MKCKLILGAAAGLVWAGHVAVAGLAAPQAGTPGSVCVQQRGECQAACEHHALDVRKADPHWIAHCMDVCLSVESHCFQVGS